MKKRTKLLSLLLCLVMLVSMMPLTAYAAEEDSTPVTIDTAESVEDSIIVTVDEASDAAEASTEVTEPAADANEPSTEATEPAADTVEPSMEVTEPAAVCDCGTDDPAIHATTCAVYVAPENPVCYCAEKCTEVNEWCDVCGFDISKCTGTDTAVGYAEGDVASVTVGDTTTNYTSLDDALIAAQNNPGSTLTLLQNIDRGSEELMIRSVPDSTFTIDLNGCTLTSTTATGTVFIQTSVNLTVVDSKGTGGIISNNNAFYIDWNNTTVNIKGVTITVTSTLDYDACVFINNSSATVNIIDSTILSERVGVYGGGTLNISGDTRITATSSNMAAIHRTGGALTITGGSITGGVYVAGGTADIIGGTITEPRDYYNAVDVVNNAQVTISGGSISGVNADLCNDSYNPGVINLTLSEGKTVGATFPSGITVEGNTLAELLSTDTAYWGVVEGRDTMLDVADDATSIDNDNITIRAICDHKDVKLDYITTETTHTPVCPVCNWTGKATEHTGGTASCQDPAICEACGISYGDKDANIHTPTEGTIFTDNGDGTHSYTCACGAAVAEVPHTLDVTTGKCVCGADMTAIATVTDGTNTYYAADAETLNQAVTAILETGSRTFTVELPADADAGMITAIRRAICDTEGVADGSIHLTLKGVTSIPGTTNWDGVAFGPGDIYDEAGKIVDQELVTQLASINLPDVTEIGAQAFYFCENLVTVSAPKAQTIGAQAFGYTALTSVEFPELTTIPTDMFSGTWTLSSVKFPKVTTIEQGGLLVGAKFSPENNPTPFPLELPAEGDITFNGSYHFNIAERNYTGKVDLVLCCDKKDDVTFHDDGTATWQVRDDLSYTFKSITFKHSYVDGKCESCGEDCAHTGGTATCTTPAVCDTCGVSYGAVDTTNHDSSVECVNGFCENGCYEPATLNAEGYYEIDNGGKLFWFAQQVNVKGNREIKGVLTADIDLENKPWTPIGVTGENNNNFCGVFDGQNYTIRGLNVEGSENGVGFFGEVRTGTVKNFTIFGNVVVNTEVDYVGGVIGSICGVNGETSIEERNGAVIQNITSFVNVTAKAHGIGMIGGFVGYANHQSLIEQCAWYGTFDAGEYRVDSGAGGFIGKIQENTSEVTIRNCGAYGTIKTNYAGDYNNTATIYMGGFLSFSNTNAQTTLENCLFAGRFERGENLTDEARLGAFGTLRSVKAIKNCYYLGDDGLAAVHSDSDLKPGSDNVEITSVTGEDLRGEMRVVWHMLGEYWTQGIHYPILKEGRTWHSDSGATYTYTDNGDGTHKKTCNECGYVEEVNEEHYVDPTTTYTDNGNGTHSFKCAKCDAVMDSEPHTIENHVCTDCGAMEIVVSFDAGDFEWKTGDKLYFCRVSRENEWEEYCFTATVAEDGTVTWTPDKTLCWDGTGEHRLIVSYPCTAVGWDDFMIPADQSEVEKLKEADCMNARWVGTPTTNVINFELKHRMAKVTVNYEVAEDVTTEISKFEVYSNAKYCIFSDADGLPINTSVGQYDVWVTPYHTGDQFTAFVSPDAYAADGNFIKITLSDGSVREVKMNKAVTFEEGAEYTYTVVITADGAYLTCADECSFEYTDNGDGTHDKVCSKCGYVAASEAHSGGTATCTEQAECQHCGASYGEVDKTNHDETVAYENGFCKNGCYEPATLNAEGFYEIFNAGQLYWFARQVNIEGDTAANGKLMADIDLENRTWYPIGLYNDIAEANGSSVQKQYAGTFDGNNHTVSNFTAIGNGSQGLFGYCNYSSAQIKNLGVINATVSGWNAGAVAGYCANLTNCYAVGCTITGASATNNTNAVTISSVGGNNGPTSIVNCWAYDCELIVGEGETNYVMHPVGGIRTSNSSGNIVQNCYYGEIVTEAEFTSTTGAVEKTEAQFASGEVAYLLGTAWGQTIGTQNYPVLGGDKVYQVKNCKQEIAYNNSNADIGHNYVNGICTVCDEACEHTGGTATCTTQAVCDDCGASYGEVDKNNHDETVAYVNGFCPNGCYEPAALVGSYYQITNAGQLYWFAQQVNSGKTNINGELKANIVINKDVLAEMAKEEPETGRFRLWTPIGTEDNGYSGDFCGLEHTVSGLYFNDSTANVVGLFGYVGSGTVNHVGVIDSYFNGSGAVGGVVGCNEGTVEYAYNTGTVKGNTYVGGVVGDNQSTVKYAYNTGTVSGDVFVGGVAGSNYRTVEYAYNTGSVSGETYVGGVAGSNYRTVKYAYNTGSVRGEIDVGGVAGENYETFATVTNCYFDSTVYTGNAIGTDSGTAINAEGKTTEQFASGEVAYLLGRPFGQNIGTNSEPVLYGETVYYGYTSCGDVRMVYTNDPKASTEKPDHSFSDGKCAVCGKELFYGTNMTLGNELDLNFALETDIVPDGAYAIITRSYADNTSVTDTIEKAKWTKQGSLSLITYEGLAAKEMCDKVSVTVYDKDGTALGTREDSIRSYAMRCIKDDTDKYSKEVKVLLIKMLDYGAEAQNEFKHNTGDLANKEITEQMRTDYPFEKQTVVNKGSAVAGQYMGTSLILKTRIEMQMGFYGDPTGVTATVSYTDHYGKAHSYTTADKVRIAEYKDADENVVAYGVIIPEIVVADARQPVTVTVTPAEGEAITVTDSIASYAARHNSAGVYGAIMDFSDAARAYFKTQS